MLDVLLSEAVDPRLGEGTRLPGIPSRPVAARTDPPRRPMRQLPDRILTAAHEACDLGALDIAGALLGVLETVLAGTALTSPTAQRRAMEGLVAAHGRVWHLRHDRQIALEDPCAPLR